MNTEKILSVVIPVYNERETILRIIEKVLPLISSWRSSSSTTAPPTGRGNS